ncbi:MAG: lysine 2,3-aminomutase [Deltaproteobacteria bacterium]|nr:lysine 2,3-aminomutase [Deltaproteobacteria bacterium]
MNHDQTSRCTKASAVSAMWGREFRSYSGATLEQIPQLKKFSEADRFAMKVVSKVLPCRINQFVIEEQIDWERVPEDPLFQLAFPQKEMLSPEDFETMAALVKNQADEKTLSEAALRIHERLNHHPADQTTLNVPQLDGMPLPGMQHKYDQTVLFFPSQGQTCHSFCTYCFRWPQFIGASTLRFAAQGTNYLLAYLRSQRQVTDLLVTGGDPMVMKTESLARILEPLLAPEFDHIDSIRIGTKALSFWPYRFVGNADADALLRLLEKLVRGGKHVAIMAHLSHAQELRPPIVQAAVKRLQGAGAVIRSQSPILRHINDCPQVWAEMWRRQVRLGIVPYYMFVARDTGSRRYFEIPLVRTLEVYQGAVKQVSGLARKARGPSMSGGPGKIEVQGVAEIQGEKVFVLRFLQARNADWTDRPFFARFDPEASWLDDLRPAFGDERFFFEEEYAAMRSEAAAS